MKDTGNFERILGRPIQYNTYRCTVTLILYHPFCDLQRCYCCVCVQCSCVGSQLIVASASCTHIFWNVHLNRIARFVFTQLSMHEMHCIYVISPLETWRVRCISTICIFQCYWLLLLFSLLLLCRFCDTFFLLRARNTHSQYQTLHMGSFFLTLARSFTRSPACSILNHQWSQWICWSDDGQMSAQILFRWSFNEHSWLNPISLILEGDDRST